MTLHWSDWPEDVLRQLREGCVIPASPLVLTENRAFDPVRQSALMRYYIDAGAGGVAVGVHATQFEIRQAGLYEPVLRTAADAIDGWSDKPIVRIAGLAGNTKQAVSEAETARGLGYHAGLLSFAAFKKASEAEIIEHCRTVADILPLVGFYLQLAVGGILLSTDFWRRFAEIENVAAIKIAPFSRYRTLDVVRGVAMARAEGRIALYTGNDDNIVMDLIAPYKIARGSEAVTLRIVGGLLGHWSVWVKGAVDLLRRCKEYPPDHRLLTVGGQVTDCNAAFFDVANDFNGCIAGIHEVLRRQGLIEGIWCLDPAAVLSPGQLAEIDRVYREYPDLNDDRFVAENLHRWLES
ncbi:dihydrodipicolinate synthase family protein [Alphaproteobacteria bacterium]|nr:dihydrodipicolinate synthase family protein [Alphaproteobacteria bacterium]